MHQINAICSHWNQLGLGSENNFCVAKSVPSVASSRQRHANPLHIFLRDRSPKKAVCDMCHGQVSWNEVCSSRVCMWMCIYNYMYVYLYIYNYVCVCMHVHACMYAYKLSPITGGVTMAILPSRSCCVGSEWDDLLSRPPNPRVKSIHTLWLCIYSFKCM